MTDTPQRQTSLPTGFGGSYDEYTGDSLDLNRLLIQSPAATYFMRVEGDGMAGDRIEDGDTLVVDRSLTPGADDIVVGVLDGGLVVRRLLIEGGRLCFYKNDNEPIYSPSEGETLEIWGVVTSSITQYRKSK